MLERIGQARFRNVRTRGQKQNGSRSDATETPLQQWRNAIATQRFCEKRFCQNVTLKVPVLNTVGQEAI
jgi:hypothetical protein